MKFFTDPRPSLSNWSTLHEYLSEDIPPPAMVSLDEYQAMSLSEQRQFDERRLRYVSSEMVISTPPLEELIETVGRVMEQNVAAAAGRRGVIVTGPATAGKTTACVATLRTAFVRFGRAHPELLQAGAVPVAFINVPSSSTPKSVMQSFADFYSIPYVERDSHNSLKRAVVRAMRESLTQVAVVDEVQNLERVSRNNGQSVDMLKDLSNESPTTFIYSGINLEQSGLLAGARGEQVARRFTPIRMSLAPGPGQWARIVKGFWNSLPLFAQNPEGPTKDEIKWLRDRSGAHMGTLASIIGQSVNMLINAGEPAAETLSIESMEAARLDLRAEQLVRLRSQQETSRSVNKSRKPKVA